MRIYFSGLGGVALGPLAEICQDADYDVLGSEPVPNLMTKQLQNRGVVVYDTQDGVELRQQHGAAPIDWFVYTAALPDDHPELVAARELGIRTSKRDELVNHIIAEHELQLIAISGTHGKTTTTGMMIWALEQLDIPVSYLVGTTLGYGPSGKFSSKSKYFVYECDEFDRNMLQFHPHLSLITSLDYDHPDTYTNTEEYIDAFRQFFEQSSHTIGWKRDIETIAQETDWQLEENDVHDVTLAGEHTRQNATLVIKACEYLGLGDATEALHTFPGTNRRFEKLADNLYTDYGHHPVEIAATLQMARELSDHVVLVYQPHQNTRQHEVRDQYTDCMELADEIYWLPTYLSREDPSLEVLSPQQLTEQLTNKESLKIADLNDELWSQIQKHLDAGKLVLCMGAGSIDGWLRKAIVTLTK